MPPCSFTPRERRLIDRLRTPLQVIRFNAEALRLEPPDPTPFVEQILKELMHMGRLSDDLLLLTAAPERMERGGPVEAGALIQRAADGVPGLIVANWAEDR